MRVALIQMNSSQWPDENLATLRDGIKTATADGATLICTPEVSNCVSMSRSHQRDVLALEEDDTVLRQLQQAADAHGVWLLLGSMAFKTADPDGRFANRSLMISPSGKIAGRYDKIHMFDVQVTETEMYRESDGYRPGEGTCLVDTGAATIGMTICYDLRFPHLYRSLAQAGASIIAVPSAFSPVTGEAHWHALLRARAIETGCFIIAPAQTGQHEGRRTYGHSLVVAPWGEVLLDMGNERGTACVDLDLSEVAKARQRVPSLSHDREFTAPILRPHERGT